MKLMIDKAAIATRVREIGEQITRDYAGSEGLIVVCILKGSCLFFSDLVREIKLDVELDFMILSSYSATSSSGNVKLVKDLDQKIAGRHVIVVEDIVDSGLTLSYLKKILEARSPASLKVCTLLNKPSARKVNVSADIVGFDIENKFVIGYGLDCDQKYRNLDAIYIFNED